MKLQPDMKGEHLFTCQIQYNRKGRQSSIAKATFNFVVAIMYSQIFNLLCDKADDVYSGRIEKHKAKQR